MSGEEMLLGLNFDSMLNLCVDLNFLWTPFDFVTLSTIQNAEVLDEIMKLMAR